MTPIGQATRMIVGLLVGLPFSLVPTSLLVVHENRPQFLVQALKLSIIR
jgi:hypothetical protein